MIFSTHQRPGFSGFFENIEWIWLAAVFLLVGGGQFLLYAMFAVTLVDITDESRR